jgi:probable HAF family extracellular repeat protein
MKTIMTLIAASSLLAALAMAQPPRYGVADLGTLGGTASVAFGINNAGRMAGGANRPAENQHPFFSGVGGTKYDLGTLGGPNGNAAGPNGSNDLAVLAETSTPDPLGEDFCGFGTHLTCLGAFWNGVMTPLPTLGGNNAEAFTLNDRSQIVGMAENSTRDPSCPSPQILDFEAVIWGPNQGDIQVLPPLSGDSVGFALGINNLGQAVGSSGSCANTSSAGFVIGPHAVLWENGSVTDLGNLGGKLANVAAAINSRGEVVGASNLPGDTIAHSFLWTKDTGMQDLGALGADVGGFPTAINNNSQMVGGSCDITGNCRAFLWQNKVMTDLNALIPADSPWYLLFAYGINDAGEIVGQALQKSTGQVHAFLAIPLPSAPGGKSAETAAQGGTSESPRVALPENVRRLFLQRLPFGRFGARPIRH